MGILHQLVVNSLPLVPGPLMRRLASRYIAGETLGEAIAKLEEVRAAGFAGVLDILGEDVSAESDARAALRAYKEAASVLAQRELDAYVSVKPTHFGLRVSTSLCRSLYEELVEHCGPLGQLVRIEMEDHTTTDATLEVFHRLRERHDNVGVVLQARLLRTPDDVAALDGANARGVDVRMVKGVYLEPAAIAHVEADAIRDAFVAATDALLERGHTVALATHDGGLADRTLTLAGRRDALSRVYFEVLLGVQEPLWSRWRAAGHKVRVYVPFGPQWRSYSQRRLRKNPEILRHVIRNALPLP